MSLVYHQFHRNCISSKRSFVYHQVAERYTLMRDDIQPKGLMIYECISRHMRVIHSMICQVCDLDKKILQKRILFCSIFWRGVRDSSCFLRNILDLIFGNVSQKASVTVRKTIHRIVLLTASNPLLAKVQKNRTVQEVLSCFLARRKGFEPPTFWFVAKHSIQLS